MYKLRSEVPLSQLKLKLFAITHQVIHEGTSHVKAPPKRIWFERVFSVIHLGRVVDLLVFTLSKEATLADSFVFNLRNSFDQMVALLWSLRSQQSPLNGLDCEFGTSDDGVIIVQSTLVDFEKFHNHQATLLTHLKKLSQECKVEFAFDPTSHRIFIRWVVPFAGPSQSGFQVVPLQTTAPDHVLTPLGLSDVKSFLEQEQVLADSAANYIAAPDNKPGDDGLVTVSGSSGVLPQAESVNVTSRTTLNSANSEPSVVVRSTNTNIAAPEPKIVLASDLPADSLPDRQEDGLELLSSSNDALNMVDQILAIDLRLDCHHWSEVQLNDSVRKLSTKLKAIFERQAQHISRLKMIKVVAERKSALAEIRQLKNQLRQYEHQIETSQDQQQNELTHAQKQIGHLEQQLIQERERVRVQIEECRQLRFSYEKTKESLATALANSERLRSSAVDNNAPTVSSTTTEAKLLAAENMLQTANDTVQKTLRRLDEMTKKYQEEANLKGECQKEMATVKRRAELNERQLEEMNNALAGTSIRALQDDKARATKQFDELRRQNRELMNKVNQLQNSIKTSPVSSDSSKSAAPTSAADTESKRRLEQASQMIKSLKTDLEKTRRRADELKASETKLKVENGKMLAYIKQLEKKAAA